MIWLIATTCLLRETWQDVSPSAKASVAFLVRAASLGRHVRRVLFPVQDRREFRAKPLGAGLLVYRPVGHAGIDASVGKT